ncbi:hypothetical protein DNTS_010995 [Danionella cerebrum]|uniref:Uncharacterized protein n=1 Tax=Danionella cerebrum TaxID=2873325 RepID=A0A553MNX6_9TELE|nr:hypothetical protein DNTS_010995 [Danionella translucida]
MQIKSTFSSFSQGAMSFMNRTKAVPSPNQRIKTEPPNYYHQPNHGFGHQNQPMYYTKRLPSGPVMQHPSESQVGGALSHWTTDASNGGSNSAALQQANPNSSMPSAGDTGNSLPLLTSLDLEILQPNGPPNNQPRQDQPNQQVQQSQQAPQRHGLEGAHGWFNYGPHQPHTAQNGVTGPSGSLSTGFSYTSSIDEEFLQSLIGNNQPGFQLKQENQEVSNMPVMNNPNLECVQSFTALLNCNNVSTLENLRQIDPNGSNNRASQAPYGPSGMGQESQNEPLSWLFTE